MRALEAFPHVVEMAVKCQKGFSFSMTAEEREECAAVMRENLEKAEQLCREGRCRLLVLDEIGSALDAGMVDRKGFLAFLDHRARWGGGRHDRPPAGRRFGGAGGLCHPNAQGKTPL